MEVSGKYHACRFNPEKGTWCPLNRRLSGPHCQYWPFGVGKKFVACVLLGISPASDCDLPTFRNPLSVPSSKAGCRVYSIQYSKHWRKFEIKKKFVAFARILIRNGEKLSFVYLNVVSQRSIRRLEKDHDDLKSGYPFRQRERKNFCFWRQA
jgi:hypothetical protein